MHFQERRNYYSIRAIEGLLIAKDILKKGEVEAAASRLADLEREEDKNMAADWWKNIQIGNKVKYGGYEGTVTSVSTEPWQAMVIQYKKNKLMTFTCLSRSLLVAPEGKCWQKLSEY